MKTYADSGVFFTAWRGALGPRRDKALNVLTRAADARELIVSPWLQLEVMPKALAFRHRAETEFYRLFFPADLLPVEPTTVAAAWKLAARHALGAMDALNLAAAIAADAEQFVTTELATKPLFQVRGIRVVALEEADS